MKAVSLFSGIGGFDLGLERAGIETVLQVEIDPFCREVLAKHWPRVRRISDVRDVTEGDVRGVDLVYGGFPCQPVSLAGKRMAQDDDRWLWPEFERVIRMARPRYVLVENVPGLLTAGLGDVLAGLSTLGFDAEWSVVSACSVGAPHPRERLFIVAYRQSVDGEAWDRLGQSAGWRSPSPVGRLSGVRVPRGWGRAGAWNAGEPELGRVAHGVPSAVDRLHALGNAVVPQVAEFVGRRLVEFDRQVTEQQHYTWVRPGGREGQYEAICTCGWKGKSHAGSERGRRDAAAHEASRPRPTIEGTGAGMV